MTTAVVLVGYYEPDENVHAACKPGWNSARPYEQLRCITNPNGDDWSAVESWGGSKVPESDVLAGAFNYLAIDELRNHLLRTLSEPFVLCHSTEGNERQWATEHLSSEGSADRGSEEGGAQ